MRVSPLAGSLGADVEGVDLSAPLSQTAFAEIEAAILEHGVLAFRDQNLAPAEQLAFARRFGDPHYHPHVKGLPEQPEVMEILKTEADTSNFGAEWHSDQAFLPAPANYTMLYAVELPEFGGDTLFACMRTAFQTLSPGMQRLACGLRSVNLSFAGQLARRNQSQESVFGAMRTKDASAEEAPAEHPVVRRHPETGDPALYVGLHTMALAGFSDAESQPLIDLWRKHLTRPEHTCRVRWRPGTLTLWDNRRVAHNAINDYQGKRRRMHRVTVVGQPTEAYNLTA